MTSRRSLLVILLLLAFVPPLFSAETLVKPETATPIEICPSCKDVSVLLVPDNKSKINLEEGPTVEAAYFNGAAPRDAIKFTAQWTGDSRGIKIVLNPDETKQAGTYDLYLNLQPKSNPSAGRLKIQLTRPAASLEAIPKLIIDRTCGFIGRSNSHPALRLTETSKKSGITISGVRPVSNSVIGARPIGGTIGFPQKLPEINPGEQVTLDYTLDGMFELGTATGTLKIDAPQLASPVSFDFEVRSHVHLIWIGITIIVALLISWWVKVKLQQKIELDQAILDAKKLVERIELEETRHADPVFVKAYQDALSSLNKAMEDKISAADINQCKVALDTEWQKALQNLATRHQAEQDSLDKLHDFVTVYDWPVPPAIVQAIELARNSQDEVQQLINGDKLTEARDKWKKIIFDLGNAIRDAAIKWQTQEQEILSMLQTGPPGIPSTIPDLSKVAADLLAFLNKVDGSTMLDTPERINQTLSEIQAERTSVKQFVDRLSSVIQGECEKAIQITNPPPANWNVSIFDKAPDAVFKKFLPFLQTTVNNPDELGLQAKLELVHQAWTSALQSQFAQPNGSVKALLDARDYVQATAVAVQQKVTVQQKTASGSVAALALATGHAPRMEQFYSVMGAAPQPLVASRTRYQWINTPAPAIPTSVTLNKNLLKEKGIQSAIFAVLLVIAGYGLQLNTFVGTFTDFSTLFFWAFALDLTADQVRTLLKKT